MNESKMKIVLNIGCENNNYSVNEILSLCEIEFEFGISRVVSSEYNGNVERTVIWESTTDMFSFEIIDAIKYLANLMTQECIAAEINGIGILVHGATANENTPTEFDANYFVN